MSAGPEQPAWKAATARQFDALAACWRQRGIVDDERLDQVVDQLDVPPGALLLDAGCGTGNWSLGLVARSYRVRGVDIAPAMIAEARTVARDAGVAADSLAYEVGDLEALPYPDATFDGLICFNAIDFTPRPGSALREFARVLRPGAPLLLSCLGAYSPVKREWWRRFLPENEATQHTGSDIQPWELEALLQALGWTLVDQYPLFGPTLAAGAPSAADEARVRALPEQVLQQTLAVSWRFVARRPAGAGVAGPDGAEGDDSSSVRG